jgi:hypothetical protein
MAFAPVVNWMKIVVVKELNFKWQSSNLRNFIGTVEFHRQSIYIQSLVFESCKYYLDCERQNVKLTAFYGKYKRDYAACHKNEVKLLTA